VGALIAEIRNGKESNPLDSRFAILNRDHKNNRLHNILKKVCFLGAVIHIIFIFFFLSIGSLWLSVLNVFSVLIWLIAMYQNQRGRYLLATLMGTIETITHAILATHFLGLSMGFHYFLWPVALLIMLSKYIFNTKINCYRFCGSSFIWCAKYLCKRHYISIRVPSNN